MRVNNIVVFFSVSLSSAAVPLMSIFHPLNPLRSQHLHEWQCHILWGMPSDTPQLRLVRTRGMAASDAFFLGLFHLWTHFSALDESEWLVVTGHLSHRILEGGGLWRPGVTLFKTCRRGAARRDTLRIPPAAFRSCRTFLWVIKGRAWAGMMLSRSCLRWYLSACVQVSILNIQSTRAKAEY